MAEIQRPRKESEIDKKERQEKLAKLKRLEMLQVELDSIENAAQPEEPKEELEILEEEIEAGISKVTKGQSLTAAQDRILEQELTALESEIQSEAVVVTKSSYEKLLELHPWIEKKNYGFMFAIPNPKKQKQDYDSWRQEWGHVLLDYAKVGTLHVLFPTKLLTEPPFNKFHDRKGAVIAIADVLVEQALAKWTGKKPRKKEELRVYWKTIEEWVSIIELWAKDNALFDVVMLPDIRNCGEEFANLPDMDLKLIFEKIEKEKKGTVVEINKNQFGIKFHIA